MADIAALYARARDELALSGRRGARASHILSRLATDGEPGVDADVSRYIIRELQADGDVSVSHEASAEVSDDPKLIASDRLRYHVLGIAPTDRLSDTHIQILEAVAAERAKGLTLPSLRSVTGLELKQVHYQILGLTQRSLLIKVLDKASGAVRLWLPRFVPTASGAQGKAPGAVAIPSLAADFQALEELLEQVPGSCLNALDAGELLSWPVLHTREVIQATEFLSSAGRLAGLTCAIAGALAAAPDVPADAAGGWSDARSVQTGAELDDLAEVNTDAGGGAPAGGGGEGGGGGADAEADSGAAAMARTRVRLVRRVMAADVIARSGLYRYRPGPSFADRGEHARIAATAAALTATASASSSGAASGSGDDPMHTADADSNESDGNSGEHSTGDGDDDSGEEGGGAESNASSKNGFVRRACFILAPPAIAAPVLLRKPAVSSAADAVASTMRTMGNAHWYTLNAASGPDGKPYQGPSPLEAVASCITDGDFLTDMDDCATLPPARADAQQYTDLLLSGAAGFPVHSNDDGAVLELGCDQQILQLVLVSASAASISGRKVRGVSSVTLRHVFGWRIKRSAALMRAAQDSGMVVTKVVAVGKSHIITIVPQDSEVGDRVVSVPIGYRSAAVPEALALEADSYAADTDADAAADTEDGLTTHNYVSHTEAALILPYNHTASVVSAASLLTAAAVALTSAAQSGSGDASVGAGAATGSSTGTTAVFEAAAAPVAPVLADNLGSSATKDVDMANVAQPADSSAAAAASVSAAVKGVPDETTQQRLQLLKAYMLHCPVTTTVALRRVILGYDEIMQEHSADGALSAGGAGADTASDAANKAGSRTKGDATQVDKRTLYNLAARLEAEGFLSISYFLQQPDGLVTAADKSSAGSGALIVCRLASLPADDPRIIAAATALCEWGTCIEHARAAQTAGSTAAVQELAASSSNGQSPSFIALPTGGSVVQSHALLSREAVAACASQPLHPADLSLAGYRSSHSDAVAFILPIAPSLDLATRRSQQAFVSVRSAEAPDESTLGTAACNTASAQTVVFDLSAVVAGSRALSALADGAARNEVAGSDSERHRARLILQPVGLLSALDGHELQAGLTSAGAQIANDRSDDVTAHHTRRRRKPSMRSSAQKLTSIRPRKKRRLFGGIDGGVHVHSLDGSGEEEEDEEVEFEPEDQGSSEGEEGAISSDSENETEGHQRKVNTQRWRAAVLEDPDVIDAEQALQDVEAQLGTHPDEQPIAFTPVSFADLVTPVDDSGRTRRRYYWSTTDLALLMRATARERVREEMHQQRQYLLGYRSYLRRLRRWLFATKRKEYLLARAAAQSAEQGAEIAESAAASDGSVVTEAAAYGPRPQPPKVPTVKIFWANVGSALRVDGDSSRRRFASWLTESPKHVAQFNAAVSEERTAAGATLYAAIEVAAARAENQHETDAGEAMEDTHDVLAPLLNYSSMISRATAQKRLPTGVSGCVPADATPADGLLLRLLGEAAHALVKRSVTPTQLKSPAAMLSLLHAHLCKLLLVLLSYSPSPASRARPTDSGVLHLLQEHVITAAGLSRADSAALQSELHSTLLTCLKHLGHVAKVGMGNGPARNEVTRNWWSVFPAATDFGLDRECTAVAAAWWNAASTSAASAAGSAVLADIPHAAEGGTALAAMTDIVCCGLDEQFVTVVTPEREKQAVRRLMEFSEQQYTKRIQQHTEHVKEALPQLLRRMHADLGGHADGGGAEDEGTTGSALGATHGVDKDIDRLLASSDEEGDEYYENRGHTQNQHAGAIRRRINTRSSDDEGDTDKEDDGENDEERDDEEDDRGGSASRKKHRSAVRITSNGILMLLESRNKVMASPATADAAPAPADAGSEGGPSVPFLAGLRPASTDSHDPEHAHEFQLHVGTHLQLGLIVHPASSGLLAASARLKSVAATVSANWSSVSAAVTTAGACGCTIAQLTALLHSQLSFSSDAAQGLHPFLQHVAVAAGLQASAPPSAAAADGPVQVCAYDDRVLVTKQWEPAFTLPPFADTAAEAASSAALPRRPLHVWSAARLPASATAGTAADVWLPVFSSLVRSIVAYLIHHPGVAESQMIAALHTLPPGDLRQLLRWMVRLGVAHRDFSLVEPAAAKPGLLSADIWESTCWSAADDVQSGWVMGVSAQEPSISSLQDAVLLWEAASAGSGGQGATANTHGLVALLQCQARGPVPIDSLVTRYTATPAAAPLLVKILQVLEGKP